MTNATAETARLTADIVLLGEHASQLYALVIRRGWDPYQGHWALPGGHVDVGEDVKDAAHRELAEEANIGVGALEFVGAYADPGRDPRGRYVTFAYTALLGHLPEPAAGDDATEAKWVPVDELLATGTKLAFDHRQIIHDALRVVL